MNAGGCMVIGLKKLLYELDKPNSGSEFFDKEKSSVRRKIAAVEIYFDLLIFPAKWCLELS